MFVLDSSVAVSWYLVDERRQATLEILARVVDTGAIVPMHWKVEVGNALLMALRRKRISADQRSYAIQQLTDLQLETDDLTLEQAWSDSLALAERFALSLYDACYLELAQRRALPLATLDADLRKAGKKLGLAVLGG